MSFRVRGIHCEGCADQVREELEALEGVRAVSAVGVDDGVVELDLDERVTSWDDIRRVLDGAGYPPVDGDGPRECDRDDADVREGSDGDGARREGATSWGGELRYGALALAVAGVGLVGYVGYEAYPRFELPAVDGATLLVLAVGAGVASFFSPCAFSLLLALLGRESGLGGEDTEDGGEGAPGPVRYAAALSLGASAFVLMLGLAIALGGRELMGGVVFTSAAGRVLRLAVGLFLILLGLVQADVLPNPLHIVEQAFRPLLRMQAEQRRKRPFYGYALFGFGYLLAGFG